MHIVDWSILIGFMIVLTAAAIFTKRYMRSVADFLSANRTAGKYLLGVADGIAGLGAITIIANFEMKYKAGFTAAWWELMVVPIMVICAMTGWVQYRYRQTRVMTMAQMLEMRYSRSFRVFSGMIAYFAGVLNFGLFPAVGGRFFQYFCGFQPHMVSFLGLEFDAVYATIMLVLLGFALAFTFLGGQIAVIITDFLQGSFCNIVFVVISIVLLFGVFSWKKITDAASTLPVQTAVSKIEDAVAASTNKIEIVAVNKIEAAAKIQENVENVFNEVFNIKLAEQVRFSPEKVIVGETCEPGTNDVNVAVVLATLVENSPKELANALPKEIIAYTNTYMASRTQAQINKDFKQYYTALVAFEEDGVSLLDPSKTSGLKDFNWTFFIMQAFIIVYGFMIWQGSQGYYGAARTPHEAKMGKIVGQLRFVIQTLPLVLIPICAYTFLHHIDYAAGADKVNEVLNSIGNEQLRSQLTVSVAAAKFLPIGLIGAFAAVMFAAFVSTHDTYLHSWGSIFIQDIVMPIRSSISKKAKPLSPKAHIMWFRIGIMMVAVYIFFFALFFNQKQDIFMFFALTGTIFLSWAGSVIIGGLYWKYGTTWGAWAAAFSGIVLAILGWIATYKWNLFVSLSGNTPFASFDFMSKADCPWNGQQIAFWSSLAIILVYIVISLITCRGKAFNMDKMLHRGQYAIESDQVDEVKTKTIWTRMGLSHDFSFTDRILYIGSYAYIFLFFGVFLAGSILMMKDVLPEIFWNNFWFCFSLAVLVLMLILSIWFLIGGVKDLKIMFARLKNDVRDDSDDGSVV